MPSVVPPRGEGPRRGRKYAAVIDENAAATRAASIVNASADDVRRLEARQIVEAEWATAIGKDAANQLAVQLGSRGVRRAFEARGWGELWLSLRLIRALRELAPLVDQVELAMRDLGGSAERKRLYPNLFPPAHVDLDGIERHEHPETGDAVHTFATQLHSTRQRLERMSRPIEQLLAGASNYADAAEKAFAAVLRQAWLSPRKRALITGKTAYFLAVSCGVVPAPSSQDEVNRGTERWGDRLSGKTRRRR